MNIIAELCESYLDEALTDVQELIPTEQLPSVAKLIERDKVLVEALKAILKECPLDYPTIRATIAYKALTDIGEL